MGKSYAIFVVFCVFFCVEGMKSQGFLVFARGLMKVVLGFVEGVKEFHGLGMKIGRNEHIQFIFIL